MSDKHNTDWWDDRVEAYVDGVLPEEESAQLQALLDAHPAISAEIVMAERIRTEFKSMGMIRCPENVSREIQRAVHQTARRHLAERWSTHLQALLGGYKKYALAGLIVVGVLVVLNSGQRRSGAEEIPVATVEQALDDVKWTLALLSGAGADAAGTVRSDVVEPLLVDRLGSTLDVLSETQN
jgi:anti-sigma factor RsiW